MMRHVLITMVALFVEGASAASMTSGYTTGSSQLTPNGETLFWNSAVLGGGDEYRTGTVNVWDTFLIDGAGFWNLGDTVTITGFAVPVIDNTNKTASGTMTFDVRQAAGGAGTTGAGGLASLGTATATFTALGAGAGVYYVNFDTPVSFVADVNSTRIGINFSSDAKMWIKTGATLPTKYNYTSGAKAATGGHFSVAGTVGYTNAPPSQITSFSAVDAAAQSPDPAVLTWSVTGAVSTLVIEPGVGDVTGLTTNGTGSVAVYPPLGMQTYTLTLNGAITSQKKVFGLPKKEKLHIYLLIGQSNMQGEGRYYNSSLDGPHPRVLKFGSREGMEPVFAEGTHKLYNLTAGGDDIGMGVEFGKTMIAAESDPEVMLCLINHAFGNTAIEWWMPGAKHPTAKRANGQDYYLYDEAVQRVHDAETYGVIKGVLWHQGEWNSNPANDSDPEGYAVHLRDLVDNLRTEFTNPSLPFICGELVPTNWVDSGGTSITRTRSANSDRIEEIMGELPNHRNNTFCVLNGGLRGHNDEMVHFDAYSQRLLGQRYAAAMINFYNDPYLLYLGGYLTPAQMADPDFTDPLGDNDGDGGINYLEHAFRFNPMLADYSPPLRISVSGQTCQVSFTKRTDTEAPVYWIDYSTNLVNWVSNGVFEVVGSPVNHGDGSATVTVQPVEDASNAFFRLQVTSE